MIIGISGQLNSGKDTVAGRFAANLKLKHIALADPMKMFGFDVFGFSKEQLWGPSNMRNLADKRFSGPPDNNIFWLLAREALEIYSSDFVLRLGCKDPKQVTQELAKWFDGLRKNYTSLSPRIMLQTLGTEWGRDSIDKDIWVNYTIKRSELVSREGFSGVIVSDVRFMNELEAIRKAEGRLVKVVRPETDATATSVGVVNHQSESEQKAFEDGWFDYVVLNNSDLEHLYCEVDQVSKQLIK